MTERLTEAERLRLEGKYLPTDVATWPDKPVVVEVRELDSLLADSRELQEVKALLVECAEALRLVRHFGGQGEIEEDGPRNGMSVSYFVDKAYEAAARQAAAQGASRE